MIDWIVDLLSNTFGLDDQATDWILLTLVLFALAAMFEGLGNVLSFKS